MRLHQYRKASPLALLRIQKPRYLPSAPGATMLTVRSTAFTVEHVQWHIDRGGGSHLLTAVVHQLVVTSPCAGAGVLDAPCFGECCAWRKVRSIRDVHIGNEACTVAAGRRDSGRWRNQRRLSWRQSRERSQGRRRRRWLYRPSADDARRSPYGTVVACISSWITA